MAHRPLTPAMTPEEKEAKLNGRSFTDLTDEEKEAYSKYSSHLKPLAKKGEPGYERSQEIRSMGGKASYKKRKARQRMRETLEELLACATDEPLGSMDEQILAFIKENELASNQQTRVMIAQLLKAVGGDTEAARFLRDTVGDKISDGVVVTQKSVSEMSDYDLKHLSNEELQRLIESGEGEVDE